MINRDHIVSFTGNLIVLLVLMFVVIDIAEGRRFINAFDKEQEFVGQQRAIVDFVMSDQTAVKCKVMRVQNTYKGKYQYTCFEPPGFADSPTVIVIPGALQDIEKHQYIGFRLACEGIRVVFAPVALLREDIRESFDEVVILAMGFLEHVREKYGRVQSVVGHSLGGLIAIRMALLDSQSTYQVFSPFLGLSICPSAVIAQKLRSVQKSCPEAANGKQANDLDYILRNYEHIQKVQSMTRKQAGYLKSRLDIYLSLHEHLVDNSAAVDFAAGNPGISVYYMQTTHYFGKSEGVIEEIARRAVQTTPRSQTNGLQT